MAKYSALGDFLRKQSRNEVPLTFEGVEKIVGSKLPASARLYRAWWSNNAHNSVITREWLEAGFESEQVDMEKHRLVFRKVDTKEPRGRGAGPSEAGITRRHPLIGSLKGLLHIEPGTDLTAPADPNWGKHVWED